MRKLFLSVLFIITTIQFSFAQSNAEQLVSKLIDDYRQNPSSAIQKYADDDFLFINAEGGFWDKKTLVGRTSFGKLEEALYTDKKIKTIGDLVVFTGVNHSRWNYGGKIINYNDAFTYTFRMKDNDIKWLSGQHSSVTLKERNKAIFREYEQLGNEQKTIDYSKFYADSFEVKDVGKGPAAAEKVRNLARKGFPDLKVQIIELIGEGDLLFARCETTGTHLGDYYGNKATGKSGKIAHWVVYRFNAEGKIVESWTLNDNLLLMQQLGIVK